MSGRPRAFKKNFKKIERVYRGQINQKISKFGIKLHNFFDFLIFLTPLDPLKKNF